MCVLIAWPLESKGAHFPWKVIEVDSDPSMREVGQ